MPADRTPHLVIPFAACAGEAWPQAMRSMPGGTLKNLEKLLQGLTQTAADEGVTLSLSPPHERVLARSLGLVPAGLATDGLIPWAAAQAAQRLQAPLNQAWAFITPCHWAMGREHATLTDPAALALAAGESQTLMAAMQPYFETEGITLHHVSAQAWLAEGELFRELATASLDRVLGRNVDAWLPGAKSAPSLRRLQNEMQMLLYTHPLNDERTANHQLTVNSFWFSGTGALAQTPAPAAENLEAPRTLAQAAFADDWTAYALAWAALDAGPVARLLERQRSGAPVRLTLCGERSAFTFETAPLTLRSRFSGFFKPQPPLKLLEQL